MADPGRVKELEAEVARLKAELATARGQVDSAARMLAELHRERDEARAWYERLAAGEAGKN